MFKAIEVDTHHDLTQFSRLLWQKKISHSIQVVAMSQILAVPRPNDIPIVIELYGQWKSGQLAIAAEDSADVGAYFNISEMFGKVLQAFSKAPVTLVLITVCIVLALVAPLNSNSEIMYSLLYPDFNFSTRTLKLIIENLSFLQFIQMITPMLLHGGLMHLAFNMLWLWEFGKRIEVIQSPLHLISLVVVLSLVSNTVQYVYSGSIRFGGMSGVVYGLFSYICMWQLFNPATRLSLPPVLIFFILSSLAIMTYIGFESIADQAHIGGLVCGMLYGAITATINRTFPELKRK